MFDEIREFVNVFAAGRRVMKIDTFAMNGPELVCGGKEGLYVPTAIEKFKNEHLVIGFAKPMGESKGQTGRLIAYGIMRYSIIMGFLSGVLRRECFGNRQTKKGERICMR